MPRKKKEIQINPTESNVSVWGELPYLVDGIQYGSGKIGLSFKAQLLSGQEQKLAEEQYQKYVDTLLPFWKGKLEEFSKDLLNKLVEKRVAELTKEVVARADEAEKQVKKAREFYLKNKVKFPGDIEPPKVELARKPKKVKKEVKKAI